MTVRLFALLLCVPLAAAQTPPVVTPSSQDLDERLLRGIYRWDTPEPVLRALDNTAYTAFALAPVAAFGLERARDEGHAGSLRLLTSEASAAVLVLGLKHVAGRPRPYFVLTDLEPRSGRFDAAVRDRDENGMPSGHTTIAFAAATSVSLTARRWYVTAPAFLWAGGVGIARVWHGVHYPSDIVAGAALGFTVAAAVHVLWPADDAESGGTVPVAFTLRF